MVAIVKRNEGGEVAVIVRRGFREETVHGCHPDLRIGSRIYVKRIVNNPFLVRLVCATCKEFVDYCQCSAYHRRERIMALDYVLAALTAARQTEKLATRYQEEEPRAEAVRRDLATVDREDWLTDTLAIGNRPEGKL